MGVKNGGYDARTALHLAGTEGPIVIYSHFMSGWWLYNSLYFILIPFRRYPSLIPDGAFVMRMCRQALSRRFFDWICSSHLARNDTSSASQREAMRSHEKDIHQQIGVEVSPLADPHTTDLAQMSCSNISTCPTNPNLVSLSFFNLWLILFFAAHGHCLPVRV